LSVPRGDGYERAMTALTDVHFDPGLAPLDRYIDVAPYRSEPHLKLALDGYAATSIGLIVQRGG
jgi:hypothetical protein